MSKLNQLGLELLELKVALASDYPEIVRRSLVQTANDLLKNQMIDGETHYLVTEPVCALEDFKNFCLEKPNYCKSEEEMLSLYEEKRSRLEEALQRCIEQENVSVVNYLKDEQIMVVKTYRFGVEHVQRYFGIERLEDCEALMGRKRFVERFVALRYPKILKEFIQKNARPTGNFKLGQSAVYYDEETQDYAIELLFKIQIETFEEVDVAVFERPISRIIERCNQWFGDYLGVDGKFYSSPVIKKEVVSPSTAVTPQPEKEVKTEQSVQKELPKAETKVESVTPSPVKPMTPKVEPEVEAVTTIEPIQEPEFNIETIEIPDVDFNVPEIESDFELEIDPDEITFELSGGISSLKDDDLV